MPVKLSNNPLDYQPPAPQHPNPQQQPKNTGATGFWQRIQHYGIDAAHIVKDTAVETGRAAKTIGKGLYYTPEAIVREVQNKPVTDIQKKAFGTSDPGQIARKIGGSTLQLGSLLIPGGGKAIEATGANLLKHFGVDEVRNLAAKAGVNTAEKGTLEVASEVAGTKVGQQALKKAAAGGVKGVIKDTGKLSAAGGAFGVGSAYTSGNKNPTAHEVLTSAWQNAAAFGAFGLAGKVFAGGAKVLWGKIHATPEAAPKLEEGAPSGGGARQGMANLSRAEAQARAPRNISVQDLSSGGSKLTKMTDTSFQQKFNDLSRAYEGEINALKKGVKTEEIQPTGASKIASAGEKIKVKVNPKQTAVDGYTHPDQLVKDMAQTYKEMESDRGVYLVHDGEAYGYGKKRVSDHSPFYRDYYAANKRPPSNQAWEDYARQELESGKAPWGASDTYQKLQNIQKGNAKLAPTEKVTGGAKIQVKGAHPETEASKAFKTKMNMRQMILARQIDAKYEQKLNALLDEYHGVKPGGTHLRVQEAKPEEPNLTAEAVAAENKRIAAEEKAKGKTAEPKPAEKPAAKPSGKQKLTQAAKAKASQKAKTSTPAEKPKVTQSSDKVKAQKDILKDAQAKLKKAKTPEDKVTLQAIVKKAKGNIAKLEGHDNNKINSIIGEGGTHYERQARLTKVPNADIIKYYYDSHAYPSQRGFEGWVQTSVYDEAKAKSLLADYPKLAPPDKPIPSTGAKPTETPAKTMTQTEANKLWEEKYAAKQEEYDRLHTQFTNELKTARGADKKALQDALDIVNKNSAALEDKFLQEAGAQHLATIEAHGGGGGTLKVRTSDIQVPKSEPKKVARIYQGTRDYLAKTKTTDPVHKSYEQDRWKLDSTRKQRLSDAATLLQNMKGITKEDKAAVWEYREAKAAGIATKPLTESQQALQDTITEIVGESNQMKGELKKLKVGSYQEEYAADAGNHRIAIDKGSALERFMSGTQKVPISGRSLRTTTASGHGRTWFALTDEAGNRKIVTIKSNTITNKLTGKAIRRDNMVTEWKGGKPEELGQMQKANQPMVHNYFDPQQREAINKVLDNLGITSKRFVKAKRGSGLGGKRAGVSLTGMSRIHVKAAAPDSVLAHELGHQVDEKYGMQDIFNARHNKELRALADARGGSKAYVRKSEEKMAVMFEAYLQAPDLFKSVAPNTYKDFVNFLSAHPELHPVRDVKGSVKLASEKVFDEPQYINGTFVDKTGKRWTIGEATSSEIGKAGNTRYFEDPLTAAVIDHVETANALQSAKTLEAWKSAPEFENIAVKTDSNPPKGWITTKLPQMQGYYFEPKVAHVLDDIYGQIKDRSAALQLLNHAVRNTIVAIPVRHNLNEIGFYFTDRGLTGAVNPLAWRRGGKALVRAYTEVMNQGDLYRKVVDTGFNFMYQDDHAFADAVNKQMSNMLSNDAAASRLAADMRMTPVKLRQVWNDVQHKGVWFQQDVLNLSRIIERMDKNGGNVEAAVMDTARFNPQYRVPSEVAGSRAASQLLRNNNLLFFGSYHYDQWKALANIVKDAAGRNGGKAALEAADKAAALALGVWVSYALIDKGLQKLSGNSNAYTKAFGVLDLPQQAYDVATGRKNVDQFVKSQLFPSFGLSTFAQLFENRDFFTGKLIYDTNVSEKDQVKQVGQWLWKQLPFDQQASNISKGKSAAAATAALTVGARYPKNSPAESELQSLKYDTLPNVQSTAKKQAQSGDVAGAHETISQYDKLVLAAAKKALRDAGKPIPPDNILLGKLRKNGYIYSPHATTINKWRAQQHTTSILDQL